MNANMKSFYLAVSVFFLMSFIILGFMAYPFFANRPDLWGKNLVSVIILWPMYYWLHHKIQTWKFEKE